VGADHALAHINKASAAAMGVIGNMNKILEGKLSTWNAGQRWGIGPSAGKCLVFTGNDYSKKFE
jgi:hypothetical protein